MLDENVQESEETIDGEMDLAEVQRQYRRKRLIEKIAGPLVSTVFHISIIIAMALIMTGKKIKEKQEISVQFLEEKDEVILEDPEESLEEELIEEPEVDSAVSDFSEVEVTTDEEPLVEDAKDDEVSMNDEVDFSEFSDVEVSLSAFAASDFMGNRSSAGQAKALSRYGGTKRGQLQLKHALNWLQKNQNPDGSWGKNHHSAMTGLAILTYLAHGDTHLSTVYGATVQKGIKWLVQQSFNHRNQFVDVGRHGKSKKSKDRNVYSHGILAYSLSEASALIPASEIAEARDIAISQVIKGQQANGGFYYGYQKGSKSNLSAASFNFQALKAAKAAGCSLSGLQPALDKAIQHLKSSAKTNEFYYTTGHKRSDSASMRCVGVLCLQLLGEADSEEAKRIGAYIAKNDMQYVSWKTWGEDDYDSPYAYPLYFWYYGTQVMFQRGGSDWKKWNKKFQAALLKNQNKDGSWETPSVIEGDRFEMLGIDKKVYSTTLCSLMLTVYYRYLPSSVIKKTKSKTVKKAALEEEEFILDLL